MLKCNEKELKRLGLPFVAYPQNDKSYQVYCSFCICYCVTNAVAIAIAASDICDGVKYPDQY